MGPTDTQTIEDVLAERGFELSDRLFGFDQRTYELHYDFHIVRASVNADQSVELRVLRPSSEVLEYEIEISHQVPVALAEKIIDSVEEYVCE